MAEQNDKPSPAKALLLRIQKMTRRQGAAPVDPNQDTLKRMATTKAPVSRRHFAEMDWARGLLLQEVIHTAVLAVAVVLVWSAVVRLKARPAGYVETPASIERQMEELSPAPIRYDILMLYLRQTLGILNQMDDKSKGDAVDLLKGMVHPDIIAAAKRASESKRKFVEENGVIQDLHIERITNVAPDEASGRITLYVHGFTPITFEHAADGVRLVRVPCVIRVVLEKCIPSGLNPYPFYMTEREVRVGPAALSWAAAK